jgi:hypothetical protein
MDMILTEKLLSLGNSQATVLWRLEMRPVRSNCVKRDTATCDPRQHSG